MAAEGSVQVGVVGAPATGTGTGGLGSSSKGLVRLVGHILEYHPAVSRLKGL